ncbi:DUF3095 domain-containing protein [Sedimentitalea sp. HM32M-2]|uniref:DUF3095 domain-containing protein n=1 Tax=Sedimentitalea sp. HM32M-2 TaxID=3351566 RepID=UPI003639F3D8
MTRHDDSDAFFQSLPRRASFADLSDPASYTPLPRGWVVGIADIVGSTEEIAAGRYKTVNMIGAAVIASQINGGDGGTFPYVFGGDGATFACGPDRAARSAEILAVMRRWAEAEFGLTLRTAQVPMADIRAAGHEVSVARYRASEVLDYAMFSGGGLSWSEARMKAGDYAVPAAEAGAIPDLTGLSCRWSNARSQNGSILSVVVVARPDAPGDAFAEVARQVIAEAEGLKRGGHPLPPEGPGVQYPPPGLALEAHASRGRRALWLRKAQLFAENLLAWFLFRTGIPAGAFDPVAYAAMVSSNADFRKFDDGLKMTLDCDADTHRRIRAILQAANADGIVDFGLFEQDEAMITCFVPSVTQDDHIHLVDGAAGGYARAASQIKSGRVD